jgi:hypothetical protein
MRDQLAINALLALVETFTHRHFEFAIDLISLMLLFVAVDASNVQGYLLREDVVVPHRLL